MCMYIYMHGHRPPVLSGVRRGRFALANMQCSAMLRELNYGTSVARGWCVGYYPEASAMVRGLNYGTTSVARGYCVGCHPEAPSKSGGAAASC